MWQAVAVDKQGPDKGDSLGAGILPQGGPLGFDFRDRVCCSQAPEEMGQGGKGVWQDSGKYPGHRAKSHYQSWRCGKGRCGEGSLSSSTRGPRSGLIFAL